MFDSSFKFYFKIDTKSTYILAVRGVDDYNVEKIRYSLDGVVISYIIDQLLEDNTILIKAGKYQFLIKDNKVVYSKQDILLRPIEKPCFKSLPISNPNIGSFDCETYTSENGDVKIYCLGFRTNLQDKPVIYYIDNKMDSDKLVLNLVNELLRLKYNDINFYCHNLGGFDIVFLLKTLCDYNDNSKDKYNISCIFRDNKILSVTISKLINNTKHKFTISDSYSILNNSLQYLSRMFKVDTIKSTFPYTFAKYNTLFYVGNTPDISYYNNIDSKLYNSFVTPDWSFKDESIKYLTDDLNSLYEVLVKANKQVFLDYGVNMIESRTISGLALNLFLKDYYNNNIPVINKSSIYNDIKQAYYGGITEVYKPYGENLYYYDVNSLYPYVCLQDMPGMYCSKEHYLESINVKLDNLFGFYYCEIDAPVNNYIGVLPLRNNDGIYFPVGKWKGWYFSEELKLAFLWRRNGLFLLFGGFVYFFVNSSAISLRIFCFV